MEICTYCGAPATLTSGVKEARIPACRQCAEWVGKRNFTTVSDGREYVLGRLENQLSRSRKKIWSEGSADMLGPNLRSVVVTNTTADSYFEALETRIRFARDT